LSLPYLPVSPDFIQPFRDLWHKITTDGPKWLIALAILVVAYLLAKLVGRLVQKAIGRTSTQGHVDILIGRGVFAIILILGVMVALSEVGLSFTHAIAALGLASVGIGFALQDILSNLFAGVILLVQHPFTIGNQVRVGNEEGMVENVRVRDTQILTYDGERVFIPNRTVFSSPIINYSSTPTLRTDLRIAIKYASEIEKARAVAVRTLAGIAGVLEQPEPVVLVESEEEHVVLILRFWRDSDRNRGLKLSSDITERLLYEFQSAGIDFLHEEPPCPPSPPPEPPEDGETGIMDMI
jgi:small conductance mechanosensitive channel